MIPDRVRQKCVYQTIRQLHEEKGHPICALCVMADIPRCSYYKWRKRKESAAGQENAAVLEEMIRLYSEVKRPNQKWLTDITEFKLSNGKKAYLSAILDLADNSIVSYVLGHSGNNQLVFDTLNKAIQANPTAHPLFHSDRGITYTNRQFKAMLDKIHATQSMSRPGRCIDNGPMEGF